jgi:hypothetical protein
MDGKENRKGASLYERTIVPKTRLLTGAPKECSVEEIQVAFAVTLLADSVAMGSGIAIGVLSMLTDRPRRRQS